MPSTVQSQAINVVNQLINLTQMMGVLYFQIAQVSDQWTDNAIASTLAAMQTVAQNADGSLGAVDGTPNSQHPLNAAVYTQLSRAVTPFQAAQMMTILLNLKSYVEGGAIVSTPGVRGVINAVSGG